jgi:hypothetical protein
MGGKQKGTSQCQYQLRSFAKIAWTNGNVSYNSYVKARRKIFGKGIYSKDGEYDHVAVYWMTESLELAADAIERHEHLE